MTIADTQRLVADAIFQDASVAAGRVRGILGASNQNWIDLMITHSLLALPIGPERTPTLLQIDFSAGPKPPAETCLLCRLGVDSASQTHS